MPKRQSFLRQTIWSEDGAKHQIEGTFDPDHLFAIHMLTCHNPDPKGADIEKATAKFIKAAKKWREGFENV